MIVFVTISTIMYTPKETSIPNTSITEENTITYHEYSGVHDFYHYKGHGFLSISSDVELTLNISINDTFTCQVTLHEKAFEMDISNFTLDGMNQITYSYLATNPENISIITDYPTLSEVYTGNAFSDAEIADLTTYMTREIEKGFPGAVLLVAHKGEVVFNQAFGYEQIYDGQDLLETPEPITTDTIFDLASLTKSFATTLSVMGLYDDGLLDPSSPVNVYDPGHDDRIQVDHLLTHTSGYAAGYRFWDTDNDYYSIDRELTIDYIKDFSLRFTPGTDSIYSDLGYAALGHMVETVSNTDLNTYAYQRIYAPLDLTHTLYQPLNLYEVTDIAATERNGNTRDDRYEFENVREYTIRGEVHDEFAYYAMNEISGHAGLFSTASDLSKLSQMLLNGGGYGSTTILGYDTVDHFTNQSEYYGRYTLGFDYSKFPRNYYRYSLLTNDGAYGKTGWTGTLALIDPSEDLIIILLTNKRHCPIENGRFVTSDMAISRYSPVITKIYEYLYDDKDYHILTADYQKDWLNDLPSDTVSLGIDRIDEYQDLFTDKNVGLITNTAARNTYGQTSVEVLNERFKLTALFAPEHGLEAALDAGEIVPDESLGDITVHSLYGNTKKPTDYMLSDLDILAFDIPEIGTRYYTYIYTMLYAMEACAENNIPYVVFDRPNTYGDQVFGMPIEERYETFTGDYGLSHVYGLTLGELAMFINDTYNIGCDLTVIPMERYEHQYFGDTGVAWSSPSPNMNSYNAALLYPGLCFVESTNISEGRGTDMPFQMFGAPFMNPHEITDAMNALNLPGIVFHPVSFTPESSKFDGDLCYGTYIEIQDPYILDPVNLGLSIIYTANQLYDDDVIIYEHVNQLAGTNLYNELDTDITLDEVLAMFVTPDDLKTSYLPYYLYPTNY